MIRTRSAASSFIFVYAAVTFGNGTWNEWVKLSEVCQYLKLTACTVTEKIGAL